MKIRIINQVLKNKQSGIFAQAFFAALFSAYGIYSAAAGSAGVYFIFLFALAFILSGLQMYYSLPKETNKKLLLPIFSFSNIYLVLIFGIYARFSGNEVFIFLSAGLIGFTLWLFISKEKTEKQKASRVKDFRETLDNISLLVFSVDKKSGDVLYWNKNCEHLSGFSHKEMTGEADSLRKLFPDKEDYVRWRNLLTATKPVLQQFESKIVDKYSERKIVQWHLLDAKLSENEDENWFVGQEITELYKNWKELQKAYQQLNDIQEIATIGTWEWNPVSGRIDWSNEMYRMFGFKSNDSSIDKLDILKAVTKPEEYIRLNKAVQASLKSKEPVALEYNIKLPGGEERTMFLQASFILGAEGKIIRYRGTNQDITQIRKAEEKARNILHASPDPIIVTDTDFNIIGYNRVVRKELKYSANEEAPKKITDFLINENELERLRSKILKRERNALMQDEEFIIQTTDRQRFFAEVSAGIIGNFDKPDAFVFFIKNITKRKLYEEELEKARKKAEESDRLKSAFLANMSHEIRTPMNAIVGFANLLTDDDTTEDEKKEFTEYINSNSSALMTLINDIIDISKIEAGEIKVKTKAATIKELLKQVLADAGEQQKILKKMNVELLSEIDDSIMGKQYKLDKIRLKQVLINLVNNALKFTDRGYIKISCSAHKSGLLFSVQDTGTGIPYDMQKKVFKRFVKGSNTPDDQYRGTGLGLSISSKLVKLMGGRIKLKSELGKGSTFSFVTRAEQLPHKSETQKNVPMKANDWSKHTILIAEDESTNFRFLEMVLKKTKARIEHAKNGKEAVKFVAHHKPSVVLMDIGMPVLDGYEATRQIKECYPDLPVIAQTAYSMADEQIKIEEAGCDSFLSKPISRKQLIKTISKFIDP